MAQKRWKPKINEVYYYIYIYNLLAIGADINWGCRSDKKRIKYRNCFRTKKEARAKLAQIKQLLKQR